MQRSAYGTRPVPYHEGCTGQGTRGLQVVMGWRGSGSGHDPLAPASACPCEGPATGHSLRHAGWDVQSPYTGPPPGRHWMVAGISWWVLSVDTASHLDGAGACSAQETPPAAWAVLNGGKGGGVREWGPSSSRLVPNDMQSNENRRNHFMVVSFNLNQSLSQNLN